MRAMPCRLKYCAYSCRFCQGQGSFCVRKRGGDGAAAKMGLLAGGLRLGCRGLFLRSVGLVKKRSALGRPTIVFAADHALNGFPFCCVQMLLHGFFHGWIPPSWEDSSFIGGILLIYKDLLYAKTGCGHHKGNCDRKFRQRNGAGEKVAMDAQQGKRNSVQKQ